MHVNSAPVRTHLTEWRNPAAPFDSAAPNFEFGHVGALARGAPCLNDREQQMDGYIPRHCGFARLASERGAKSPSNVGSGVERWERAFSLRPQPTSGPGVLRGGSTIC
jgi:hypothetical protein